MAVPPGRGTTYPTSFKRSTRPPSGPPQARRSSSIPPLYGTPTKDLFASVCGVLVGPNFYRGLIVNSLFTSPSVKSRRGLVYLASNVRTIYGRGRYFALCRFVSYLLGVTFVVNVGAYDHFVRGSGQYILRGTTNSESSLLFTTKRDDTTFASSYLRSV